MSSQSQLAANRQNSLLSTGPKTNAGIAIASRNALRHGLTSKAFVIPDELREDFDALEAGLRTSIQPSTPLEDEFFREILRGKWNLRRCDYLEKNLFLEDIDGTDPILADDNQAKLKRISQYRRASETSVSRAIRELAKIQTEIRFRLQMFPPDSSLPYFDQAPHNTSLLCNLRIIVTEHRHQARIPVVFIPDTQPAAPQTEPIADTESQTPDSTDTTPSETTSEIEPNFRDLAFPSTLTAVRNAIHVARNEANAVRNDLIK